MCLSNLRIMLYTLYMVNNTLILCVHLTHLVDTVQQKPAPFRWYTGTEPSQYDEIPSYCDNTGKNEPQKLANLPHAARAHNNDPSKGIATLCREHITKKHGPKICAECGGVVDNAALASHLLGPAINTPLKPSVKFSMPLLIRAGVWRGIQAYLLCSHSFIPLGLVWAERGMGTLYINIPCLQGAVLLSAISLLKVKGH